jgi:hypothetical protein
MHTGEKSTKIDLKYNEHGDEVDSFDSGHSVVVGFVNSVMKLHIQQRKRNFLTTQVLDTQEVLCLIISWDTTEDHVHKCNANTSQDEEMY